MTDPAPAAHGTSPAGCPVCGGPWTDGRIAVPIVGTEFSTTKPSTIPFFKDHGVKTTIDNLDLAEGKRSLSRTLAGVVGHFGIKATATDGKIAKRADAKLAPLQYRPSAAFVPADERDTSDGLVSYVDTRRGTNSTGGFSRGNNLPATAWPNGSSAKASTMSPSAWACPPIPSFRPAASTASSWSTCIMR